MLQSNQKIINYDNDLIYTLLLDPLLSPCIDPNETHVGNWKLKVDYKTIREKNNNSDVGVNGDKNVQKSTKNSSSEGSSPSKTDAVESTTKT